MTIAELMAQLRNVDENTTLTMQQSDGTQRDITRVSLQGDRVNFLTDNAA